MICLNLKKKITVVLKKHASVTWQTSITIITPIPLYVLHCSSYLLFSKRHQLPRLIKLPDIFQYHTDHNPLTYGQTLSVYQVQLRPVTGQTQSGDVFTELNTAVTVKLLKKHKFLVLTPRYTQVFLPQGLLMLLSSLLPHFEFFWCGWERPGVVSLFPFTQFYLSAIFSSIFLLDPFAQSGSGQELSYFSGFAPT